MTDYNINNKMPRANLTSGQRFFASGLGGFDEKTISQCDSATINLACIVGATILIPTSIAFTGMYNLLDIFTPISYYKLAGAVVFTGTIFIIDKGILATTGIREGLQKIIFRILLSIIISTVTMLPIKLEVFADEIKVQMQLDQLKEEEAIRGTYQVLLDTIQLEIDVAQARLDERYEELRNEIDGEAMSGRKGYGKIARIKMTEHEKEERRFNSFLLERNQAQTEIVNKRDLAISNIYEREAKIFTRIKALYNIEDKEINFWLWIIMLFVLSLELAPVIIKLSCGKKLESYYAICERNSESSLHIVESTNDDYIRTQEQKRRDDLKRERLHIHINQAEEFFKLENKRADLAMRHIAFITAKVAEERTKIHELNIPSKEKKQALDELEFLKQSILAVTHAQAHNSNSFYNRRYTKHDDDEFDVVLPLTKSRKKLRA